MKKTKFIMLLFLGISASLFAQDDELMDTDADMMIDEQLLTDATEAKEAMIKVDAKIETHFDNAYGYVVFPNVGKGALVVGAASGNGIVYENGDVIGTANLKQLDIGLQAGGQAYREVIFFENESSFTDFKENDYKFAAGASAVVLKSGKGVKAEYTDGVAVVVLPKAGLMAEAAVGGQRISFTPAEQ